MLGIGRAREAALVLAAGLALGACSGGSIGEFQPAALPEGSDWVPDGDHIVVFAAVPSSVVGLKAESDPCAESWATQIFVRDMETGEVECVSVGPTNEPGGDTAWSPVVTPDGRFVTFVSKASNLVPGDTNDVFDVFVRDRATGETRRVSLPPDWHEFNADAENASISDNGRYIAFANAEETYIDGQVWNYPQVYRFDQSTGESLPLAVDSEGNWPNGLTSRSAISGDGSRVAYVSFAANLLGEGDGSEAHVFVWDAESGTSTDIGVPASSPVDPLTISSDGNRVAFESPRVGTYGESDFRDIGLCVVDVEGGRQKCIGEGRFPAFSHDARFVFFVTDDPLDPTDIGSGEDVYRYDTQTGATTFIDVSPGTEEGLTSWKSGRPPFSLSPTGRYVVYRADVPNPEAGKDESIPSLLPATYVYDLVLGVAERVA